VEGMVEGFFGKLGGRVVWWFEGDVVIFTSSF
jgi:hypothetical protein